MFPPIFTYSVAIHFLVYWSMRTMSEDFVTSHFGPMGKISVFSEFDRKNVVGLQLLLYNSFRSAIAKNSFALKAPSVNSG